MDVENIDTLNSAELDALLERALDPLVPVEVFYAVLERIGRHDQALAAAAPAERAVRTRGERALDAGSAGSELGAPDGAKAGQPERSPHQAAQTPSAAQQMLLQALKAQQQVSRPGQAVSGRRVPQHGPAPRPLRPMPTAPSASASAGPVPALPSPSPSPSPSAPALPAAPSLPAPNTPPIPTPANASVAAPAPSAKPAPAPAPAPASSPATEAIAMLPAFPVSGVEAAGATAALPAQPAAPLDSATPTGPSAKADPAANTDTAEA